MVNQEDNNSSACLLQLFSEHPLASKWSSILLNEERVKIGQFDETPMDCCLWHTDLA